MFDICSFPTELVVGDGIQLKLNTTMKRGTRDLKDIVWYEYQIVNHQEKGMVYDNICLSPFRITEDIRLEASQNIVEERVSFPDTPRPHIDYETGNIHPSKEYIEAQNKGKVLQLVLCKGLGPHTRDEQGENVYIYKNRPKQKGSRIHKACYFPLIDMECKDDSILTDWRYIMLQEVWEKISLNMGK